MPSSSSARSDFAPHLGEGGSRRTGSWNSSDLPQSYSSTPRPHRRNSCQAPSSLSRGFTSSPPFFANGAPSSREPSPTPTTSASILTSSFEKWNNDAFYRYRAEYDKDWATWTNSRPEFKSWINSLPRDKRQSIGKRGMKWGNSNIRSSQYWEHFQERASNRGVPHIRCISCSHLIQHLIKNGNSGMKDHYESKKCRTERHKKSKDPKIMDALRKQGERVYMR